ncbi:MAG: hypothetical protein PHS59_01505 [Paludibacter sp.]|nr:hypothetical protein [Paludibacter sp.]
MIRQEQKLLIGILTAAGMLLLLLYSPWGSPDLYTNKVYFAENQGVNFSRVNIGRASFQVNSLNAGLGSIKAGIVALNSIRNAPSDGAVNRTESPVIQVDDNYSKRKNENRHSANNYPSTGKNSNRLIAYNRIPNSRKIKSENSSQSTSYSSNFGGSSSTNSSATGGSINSFNSSATYAIDSSPIASVSSLNVDLTIFNDSTTSMAMDSAQKGASDPGDGPIEPVPAGDGWMFLLVLAAIYIIFKRKMLFNKAA